MIPEKVKKILRKQHYVIVGKHSGVQICRWTKKSLIDEGVCYKEKFYGIKSHECCQMTPAVMWCPNKCLHCWRAIELTLGDKLIGKTDSPKEIIEECIKAQKKLLTGFKSNKKINMKKFKEAQEPMQFAISLSGEPMIYNKIGELIKELRKRKKTSFLVTNGLYPEKIQELIRKKQLPTQLYISVNTPNKELYKKFHRSSKKDAWKRLNKSLELMSKIKTRTVIRITLVKDLNMIEPENYAKLIKKANPTFVEVKGYMAVGFARQRLGYERMPYHEDIVKFAKKILKFLPDARKSKISGATKSARAYARESKQDFIGYKILEEQEVSRVLVLGKDRNKLKIKKNQL